MRAWIAIVARAIHRRVLTAPIREATVDRTRIRVITGQASLADTIGFDADIARRAGVTVIAIDRVGAEHTSQGAIARIVSAVITIFADERLGPGRAAPFAAEIA